MTDAAPVTVRPRPAAVRSTAHAYRVTTPARLHFGLLNQSGALGRIDGGLGIAVRSPRWRFTLHVADVPSVDGRLDRELRDAASVLLRRVADHTGRAWAVHVDEDVPAHAGFGSKTSLLAALVIAIDRAHGAEPDLTRLATLTGRGGTSGVGINLVQTGGVVLDLGRAFPAAKGAFGPSSTSQPVPPAFLTAVRAPDMKVVHLRFARTGPSGWREKAIFDRACPVSVQETMELFGHTFGQLVPGLIEGDERSINQGLQALQERGLKRHEWDEQSAVTLAFRQHVRANLPETALALSSMGPTLFVLARDPEPFLATVRSFAEEPLELVVTRPSSAGTVVERLS